MGLFGNKKPGESEAEQAAPASSAPAGAPAASPAAPDVEPGQLTPEALRIAHLLSISPDMVNVTVNVGFNTKLAVEEILELRKENADLREENRRLRARCGDISAEDDSKTKEHGQKSISDMTTRELAAALQANEARVRELELENARARMQMVFVPGVSMMDDIFLFDDAASRTAFISLTSFIILDLVTLPFGLHDL